jgi:hypothetical protein
MMGRTAKSLAPEHLFSGDGLGRLGSTLDSTGLCLGRDRGGNAVPLRFFGPGPNTVTFAGGWWAARVLLFRLLALGTTVAVRATDPSAPGGGLADLRHWTALDETAGGGGSRVWPMAGEHLVWLPAAATRPVLHLYDVGPAGPASRPVLDAWQTQLTVLGRLEPAGRHALTVSDLVLAQRLGPAEARLAQETLGLDPRTASMLEAMDDDMIAVLTGGTGQAVWLTPTAIERQLFGNPYR